MKDFIFNVLSGVLKYFTPGTLNILIIIKFIAEQDRSLMTSLSKIVQSD